MSSFLYWEFEEVTRSGDFRGSKRAVSRSWCRDSDL
jgi:hypothetical protein